MGKITGRRVAVGWAYAVADSDTARKRSTMALTSIMSVTIGVRSFRGRRHWEFGQIALRGLVARTNE